MRRTWWEYGISAAVLLLVSLSINCELIAGLQERFPPVDDPGGQENAYTCECSLTVFGGDEELPDKLAFTVCASDTVGRDPISGKLDVTDINNDCQVRVATTYTLMAEACPDIAFVEAKCLAAAVPARFEQACPQEGQIAECAQRGSAPRLLELRSGATQAERCNAAPRRDQPGRRAGVLRGLHGHRRE